MHEDTTNDFSEKADANFSDFKQVDDVGTNVNKPYVFLELCAGSASLSAEVKKLGLEVFAFDHDSNRHQTKCKVISMDLSQPHAIDRISAMIHNCVVLGVHIGPPCGTCSKARGIPMADGSAGPQPLRSESHLLGLSKLRPHDRARVDAANLLYSQLGRLVEILESHNIPWTIENPTNSFLWDLPYFAFAMAHGTKFDCHACAYGSTRKKLTSFLANRDEFHELSKFCQDVAPHQHEGWGYDSDNKCFNTAKEAEYPLQMCQQYARILEGFMDNKLLQAKTERMLPQVQPKGRKTPQLIPEFLDVTSCLLDVVPAVDNKKQLIHAQGPIPAGSKLLRAEANKGKSSKFLCVFGIYRTMAQFVDCAKTLWHPFDELRNLPDNMIKSLFLNLTESPHLLAKQRCQFLKKWSTRAAQLQTEELKVHQSMSVHVQRIMAGKRVLLMEELATEMDWPDVNLFKEMRSGFKLVGNFESTGVFKPGVTIPSLNEEELKKNTKFLRPAILGRLRNFDNEELQKELFKTTLEEATEKRWLDGPFDVKDMHEQLGDEWLPVRRFGIMQKEKLRPIDNFKESMLNLTFGCFEKVELRAMEHVLWMLVTLVRYMRLFGEVTFVLSTGEVLRGHVHPSWNKVAFGVEATCVDMKAAYEQLPLNPCEYHRTVVSLWDVQRNQPSCFLMRTLPFGAAASVHHFLRVSSFLHSVGLYAGLCWGAYFDDFPLVCNIANRQSTLSTALGIFELLGFAYSSEKLEPFSKVATMLGVELDLESATDGLVRVRNKASRVEEVSGCINEILQCGFVDASKLPSYLGKLQFAEAQLWGRAGRLALADLREATLHKSGSVLVTSEAREALLILLERFTNGKPREIRASMPCKPHLLFTDGALEYDTDGRPEATIGGVMIDREGTIYCFGCDVPETLMQAWQAGGRTHVIGLVELYAAVVGLNTWKRTFCNDRVILFTDSWPAYDVIVKGTSSVKEWRDVLLSLEVIDEGHPMHLWTSRVPSSSNPADPPSRGRISDIAFLGKINVIDPVCPISKTRMKSYDIV